MKKNKTLNKLIILLTLLTPTIINAKELIVCGGNKKFPTVIGTLISTVYTIIRILVPILLVISGIISFFKVTFNGNVEDSLDKAKKKLVTNIISAIVIFFIASIINFVIGLAAGKNNSFTDCMYCMLHPEECEQTDSEVATLCPGLISEQYKYNSDCTLKDEYKNGEKIDYSNTGDTKVPAYSNTIAKAGGGAIARTLTDNPNALTNQNIITKSDVPSGYSYYLYVPKKVDNPSSPPLIVYLHGNGTECGYGYDLMVKGFGFAKYIDKGMEFNTYILMPQKHNKNAWDIEAIKRIMDTEVANNNIDKNRISIWGYSQGAEDVPKIVNASPNTFASAVILAKKFDNEITGFNGVSTYGFYGTADGYANPSYPESQYIGTPHFINKLKNAGHTAYIKAYPGVDHDHVMENLIVDQDIGNGFTNIMDWVLDQRRNN